MRLSGHAFPSRRAPASRHSASHTYRKRYGFYGTWNLTVFCNGQTVNPYGRLFGTAGRSVEEVGGVGPTSSTPLATETTKKVKGPFEGAGCQGRNAMLKIAHNLLITAFAAATLTLATLGSGASAADKFVGVSMPTKSSGSKTTSTWD